MKRIGEEKDGEYVTTFGKLFKDETLEQQVCAVAACYCPPPAGCAAAACAAACRAPAPPPARAMQGFPIGEYQMSQPNHPVQLESLVGSLKAAKKRKILHFEGQMLLQGAHDNVEVKLLKAE